MFLYYLAFVNLIYNFLCYVHLINKNFNIFMVLFIFKCIICL